MYDIVTKIPFHTLLQTVIPQTFSVASVLQTHGCIQASSTIELFNWGRTALYWLFKQLPYETVHFPAFTCSVLTDAALAANKKVELLECDLETYNLDLSKLPRSMECLVVVHTFGNPVDIAKIRQKYPKTMIIEDCAHGLFSQLNGHYMGKGGDVVLFSLYKQIPNLNGAALVFRDNKQKSSLMLKAEQKPRPQDSFLSFWPRILFKTAGPQHAFIMRLRRRYINTLENHAFGSTSRPHRVVEGLFFQGIEAFYASVWQRRQVARWYQEALLRDPYVEYQQVDRNAQPSWYQFVIRLKPPYQHRRDEIVRSLRQQDVFLDRLWYSAPITEQRFASFQAACPNALQLAQSVISLPIDISYTQDEVATLIDILHKQLEQ